MSFFVLCLVSSLCAGTAAGFPTVRGWRVFSVISAVVAKFSVTLTFLVVYLQATEIFPTPLRSSGTNKNHSQSIFFCIASAFQQ